MIPPRITLVASLTIGLLAVAACDTAAVITKPVASTNANVASIPLTTMAALLSGASEVPPTRSTGTGVVQATFDRQTRLLNWSITYSGLSGPATAAHFHGPAELGTNAPPVVPLSGSLESPIKGKAILTAAQVSDLIAGNWYLNLHTAANPGGEIRGQVTAKP